MINAQGCYVPDIGEIIVNEVSDNHTAVSYSGERAKYRVSGWLKRYVRPAPVTEEDKFLDQLMSDIFARHADQDKATNQISVIRCTREEAEFVTGSGVCGVIWPVRNATVVGKVSWDEAKIDQARQSYLRRISDDFPTKISNRD